MKKIIYFIGILISFYSCQQEDTAVLPAFGESQSEKIPVRLNISLAATPELHTEMVPMTRSETGEVKTKLSSAYRVIFIKWSHNAWIIDTLLRLGSGGQINFTDTTNLPSITLELRPGTYKAGVFYNIGVWNKELKAGQIVSYEKEINDHSTLPAAFKYLFNSEHGRRKGAILAGREFFAGYTEFTIEKNNELKSTSISDFHIRLNRKVTRLRFALKLTPGDKRDFEDTEQHFFTNIKSESVPFCDGINILGGPYYKEKPTRQFRFYITLTNRYNVTVNNMNGICFLSEPSNAHCYAPYIIMDDSIPELKCTLDSLFISGQSSQGIDYLYEEIDENKISRPLPITLKPNSIQGFVFTVSTLNTTAWQTQGQGGASNDGYFIGIDPAWDVRNIVSHFFEWNTPPNI